jgi:CDP-4-dehydro-6-deoxyglucose reductase
MEHKITLLPGNKTTVVRSEETLLDSLLGAGVAVKYNCSNGSCGACRARLIAGELGQQQYHDYVFTSQEKELGYFLMCRCHPGSDLEIEVDLFSSVEDVPEQTIDTRVYRITDPRPDFRVIELRTPRTQTLQFLPGQHVQIEIAGLPVISKSIASCPCNGRFLQFHFHRAVAGPVTDYIFEQLKTRTAITVNGPYGHFTFDEQSERPVIFIATSTGFAPIKSLIEHVIALEVRQPLHLFWCVQKDGDDYLSNYCRSWLSTEDNFIYTKLSLQSATIPGPLNSEVAQQYIAEQIGAIYHDLSEHDVYFSGPATTYGLLVEHLNSLGIQPGHLFVDTIHS